MIKDATDKTLNAMTVFSISIKYITEHLLKSLSDSFQKIEMDNIHFVLTVPAIWDDKAKQFMTEAAVKVSKKQLFKFHSDILPIHTCPNDFDFVCLFGAFRPARFLHI